MSIQIQRALLWSFVVAAVFIGVGLFVIAGFFPPHAPTMDATDVAIIMQRESVRIRIGVIMGMFGMGGLIPLAAVISEQLKRIPNLPSAVERVQFTAGGLGQAFAATLACYAWILAAFRPDRNAEITQMLNDLGWILLITPFNFLFIQVAMVALATFCDRQNESVFPRWFGFFSVFAALSFFISPTAALFKDGPFAWNGLFPFYVEIGIFGLWNGSVVGLLFKAISRQSQVEHRSSVPRSVSAEDGSEAGAK